MSPKVNKGLLLKGDFLNSIINLIINLKNTIHLIYTSYLFEKIRI